MDLVLRPHDWVFLVLTNLVDARHLMCRQVMTLTEELHFVKAILEENDITIDRQNKLLEHNTRRMETVFSKVNIDEENNDGDDGDNAEDTDDVMDVEE